MIGQTCAVSAGHCLSTFHEVHFNTPLSRNGRIQLPGDEDIYPVDRDSVVYKSRGIGSDWAVLRIKPNEMTGMYPGEVQGHLEMGYHEMNEGDIIRITGYGTATGDDVNFAQQTHTGPITTLNESRNSIGHRADTTGGETLVLLLLMRQQEKLLVFTLTGDAGEDLELTHQLFILTTKRCKKL